MDPEMINGLSKQVLSALKAMEKSKNVDEKLKYSEVVKNLCESMGVFLNLITEMGRMNEGYDDEDFEDEFNDDEDENNNDNIVPF